MEKELPIVECLIKYNADVNKPNKYKHTPLHYAATSSLEIVKLLLQNAALEKFNSMGETPLHNAARYGRADIVQTLLDAGFNVNAQSPKKGHLVTMKTPLHSAIYAGFATDEERLKTIKLLVENKADRNLSIDQTRIQTPLSHAESYLSLCKHGFNDNEDNRANSVALMEKVVAYLKNWPSEKERDPDLHS